MKTIAFTKHIRLEIVRSLNKTHAVIAPIDEREFHKQEILAVSSIADSEGNADYADICLADGTFILSLQKSCFEVRVLASVMFPIEVDVYVPSTMTEENIVELVKDEADRILNQTGIKPFIHDSASHPEIIE